MLEIRWGLLIGLARAIWMLLEYFLGWHGRQFEHYSLVSSFDAVILLVGIPLAIRDKRQDDMGELISFRVALRTGIIVTAVAASVSVLFMIMYFNVINPGWTEFAAEYTRQQMQLIDAPQQEIAEAVENARIKFSRGYKMFETAISVIIQGSLLSVLAALLLRRKN